MIDLARELGAERLDELPVVAIPHRCIQVDHLHEREFAEALNPCGGIVKLQSFAFPLNKLHDLARHQIDGWN